MSPAQTGTSYTVRASDNGSSVAVIETAPSKDATPAGTQPSNKIPVYKNSGAPSFTQAGGTLTANPGTWSPATSTYTVTWLHCTTSAPTSCTASPTSTNSLTYQVQPGDAAYPSFEVSVAATDGTTTSTAVESPVTPVVGVPVNTARPRITGTPGVFQVLSVTNGTYRNGATSFIDTWLTCSTSSNCVSTSYVGPNYVVQPSDAGHTIEVQEVAGNSTGEGAAVVSPQSSKIVAPPQPYYSPGISGSTQIGQTLSEMRASWMGSPSGIAIQWYRCSSGGSGCVAIPGATGGTYAPTAPADIGSALVVSETATNGGGSTTAWSAPTAPVTVRGAAPSTTSLTVSPSRPVTDQAVTLIATVTSSAGQDPVGAVSMYANGHAIPECLLLPANGTGQSVTVSCQTSFASSATLSASFSPADGTYVSASSASSAVLVGRAATTVDLSVPQLVTPGSRSTYSAAVTVPGAMSGSAAPTGTVDFFDGGKRIAACSKMSLSKGGASCKQSLSRSSVHQITASYSGSGTLLPSKSGTEIVTVGAPSGFIVAYLAWTFNFTPSYTRVLGLQASQLNDGSTITLLCRGKGCPFKRHDIPVRKRCRTVKRHKRCSVPSAIDLTPPLKGRHLGLGATLRVDITHSGWLGKGYAFVVRPRRKPQTTVSCLDVSSLQPGSCGT